MKYIFLILVLFTLTSCSSTKGVYWCGDHACINKKERNAYFKKTMIVEKRDIKNEKKLSKSEVDIIEKKIKEEENYKSISEKKARKLAKEKEKAFKKEEKRRLKQAKLDEKRRLKEEKKRLKQLKRERKKKIKDQKKKLNNQSMIQKKDEDSIINEKSVVLNVTNKFSELKNKIIKKNANKKYPDINDIPN